MSIHPRMVLREIAITGLNARLSAGAKHTHKRSPLKDALFDLADSQQSLHGNGWNGFIAALLLSV